MIYEEKDSNTMQKYISKLFSSPAFETLPPISTEYQIQLSLYHHEEIFKTHLSSQSLFPHLSWDETKKLLYKTLREMTNEIFIPSLHSMIENHFLEDEAFSQLIPFLSNKINEKHYRQRVDRLFWLLHSGILENYFPNQPDFIKQLKFSLLLYPITITNEKELFITPEKASILIEECTLALPYFPKRWIQSAIYARISPASSPNPDEIAQHTRIFYDLSKIITLPQDETLPCSGKQKSWLFLQQKNATALGYNPDLVQFLYKNTKEYT